ncbi:MAG: DUF503 domain-containing protein [Candidatus Dadabacteria bacterium]|nr:DUF503 domain-containing protein [Candidatus Dadabacteria bacterium]MCZ6639738.1 DUF503 domain-containing protein [Candidatus Dadabacteria bacterium]
MVIGILRFDLYMDGNRSLKDKRRILKSLIHRAKSRYNNISIAEVGSNDLLQKATIGISFVSNDKRNVNSMLDQVTGFIESTGVVQMGSRELEIINF